MQKQTIIVFHFEPPKENALLCDITYADRNTGFLPSVNKTPLKAFLDYKVKFLTKSRHLV